MKAQKQLPQTSLFSGSTSSASALYVDLKFCVHVLLQHGLRRVRGQVYDISHGCSCTKFTSIICTLALSMQITRNSRRITDISKYQIL